MFNVENFVQTNKCQTSESVDKEWPLLKAMSAALQATTASCVGHQEMSEKLHVLGKDYETIKLDYDRRERESYLSSKRNIG